MVEPPNRRRLCVFARAPNRGRVKTRLAAGSDQTVALAAHIELVEGTLKRCSTATGPGNEFDSERIPDYQTELWLADAEQGDPLVEQWIGAYDLRLRRQQGENLGQRMRFTLAATLADDAIPVLIGTDCPDIDSQYVRDAFKALAASDVVLGPAEDGGYGLIGVKQDQPGLFTDIDWGSSQVLAQTLLRADRSGATVALLETVFDVDTIDDWLRYQTMQKLKT